VLKYFRKVGSTNLILDFEMFGFLVIVFLFRFYQKHAKMKKSRRIRSIFFNFSELKVFN